MAVIDTVFNDAYLNQAILEIKQQYNADVFLKGKLLRKFGINRSMTADTLCTVGTFQGNAANETFATANTIDRVISDDSGDAGKQVTIEGLTVNTSTGDMTFVVQNATLGDQTAVALDTPLFRATRIYGSGGTYLVPQGALAGNIAVYDSAASGGLTSFLPTTAAATKVMIVAGEQQSTKAATAISSVDFWIVTTVKLNLDRSAASTVTASGDLYTRQLGNEFRPAGLQLQCRTNGNASDKNEDKPYPIIPNNSDVRLMSLTATSAAITSGFIGGYLARIQPRV